MMISGDDGDNTLDGTPDDDVIYGLGGNDTIDGGAGNDTMTGGTGDDTYIIDSAGDVVIELAGDPNGNDTVKSWLANYTLVDNVENLTLLGSADINGIGNARGNTITGNSGNNVLDGGGGGDALYGMAGDDSFIVSVAGTFVIESIDEGNDTVFSALEGYALPVFVENLVLSGSVISGYGNDEDNVITGNASNNILSGHNGDDRIDGGAGADTMYGGVGNDTFYVDNTADRVSEGNVFGFDTVYASVNFTLGLNVEALVLTGPADIAGAGSAMDNSITGNSGANVLRGQAGNDRLDGAGGADVLYGGAGDDTFIIDNLGDKVVEAFGEGYDTVYSSVSYTIGNQAIEEVHLTGSGNIDVIGNDQINILYGNDGNNLIDGRGDGGNNMYGGAGNDTYVVRSLNDHISESQFDTGIDTVQTSLSWYLSVGFENLTLTGTEDQLGAGNEANNVLIGNSGNNSLVGYGGDDTIDGGLGADVMAGGMGNDTFYIDNAGDVLQEVGIGGIDTAYTKVSYSLVGLHVENLIANGPGNLNLIGNSKDNVLTGNAGHNLLDGKLGIDIITGGAGNDTYFVDNAGDQTIELAGQGNDSVLSLTSWTLADNIEVLTLGAAAGASNGTGNASDNTLQGNASANQLWGLGGNDFLRGFDGDDRLEGGAGNDRLFGGEGADTFVFAAAGSANGNDQVGDFLSGTDHLSFTAADFGFDSGHVLTSAELSLTGRAAGSGPQFIFNAVNHALYWDADGAGGKAAAVIATLSGAASVQTGDFVFT